MDTAETSGMRVSDAEREQVAELLKLAVGDGRLDLAAYDERLRAAYSAVTRAELAQVHADLPRVAAPAPAPVPVTKDRGRSTGWAEAWRGWLGAALVMIGIWAAVSLSQGEFTHFWPGIPIGIWAAVLIASMVSGKQPHHGCASRR